MTNVIESHEIRIDVEARRSGLYVGSTQDKEFVFVEHTKRAFFENLEECLSDWLRRENKFAKGVKSVERVPDQSDDNHIVFRIR